MSRDSMNLGTLKKRFLEDEQKTDDKTDEQALASAAVNTPW